MPSPIQREFDYYLENQEAIALRYQGRFVVIKNCEVIADYSTDFEAVTETSKKHPLGSFLVQKAEAGEDDVAQIFHSRVSFC